MLQLLLWLQPLYYSYCCGYNHFVTLTVVVTTIILQLLLWLQPLRYTYCCGYNHYITVTVVVTTIMLHLLLWLQPLCYTYCCGYNHYVTVTVVVTTITFVTNVAEVPVVTLYHSCHGYREHYHFPVTLCALFNEHVSPHLLLGPHEGAKGVSLC